MGKTNNKIRKNSYFFGLLYIFSFLYPNILIEELNSSQGNFLNTKCPTLTIKKFTYITFDKIEKSNFIDLSKINCLDIIKIDELDSSKVNITTGRKSGKSVSCLSDSRENPCKFIVGEFKENLVPNVALKRIFEYKEPKPEFLNETNSRLFINIYKLLEKKYKNINTSLVKLNNVFDY